MPVTVDAPAPYAPSKAILDLIARHRDRGLPSPVTAEVLGRAGITDSLLARTLQALVSLELIDANGMPTPQFEGIRLAPEAEYKKRLQEWLRAVYADIFSFVDPTKDDGVAIRDAFRTYQPTGQQERMVTLFTGLCAAAGLMPEKSAQTTATPRPKSKPSYTRTQAPMAPKWKEPKSGGAQLPSGLPPALSGLLETLPAANEGWTKSQRDKFVATFSAVLDYSIPIVTERQKEAAE